MSSILKAALLGIIIFCVTILLLVPVAFVFTGQDDGASSTVNPIEEKARNNIDIKSHHTTLPLQAEFYRLLQPVYNKSEIVFCDYSVNDCLNNPLHQQGLISKFLVLLNE